MLKMRSMTCSFQPMYLFMQVPWKRFLKAVKTMPLIKLYLFFLLNIQRGRVLFYKINAVTLIPTNILSVAAKPRFEIKVLEPCNLGKKEGKLIAGGNYVHQAM